MKASTLIICLTVVLFSCRKENNSHFTSRKVMVPPLTVHHFSFHGSLDYDRLALLPNQILTAFQPIYNGNSLRVREYVRQFLSEYIREKKDKKVGAPANLPPEKALGVIKRYLRNDFGTIENLEVKRCLRTILYTVKATGSYDTVRYKQQLFRLEKQIQENKTGCPDEENKL